MWLVYSLKVELLTTIFEILQFYHSNNNNNNSSNINNNNTNTIDPTSTYRRQEEVDNDINTITVHHGPGPSGMMRASTFKLNEYCMA